MSYRHLLGNLPQTASEHDRRLIERNMPLTWECMEYDDAEDPEVSKALHSVQMAKMRYEEACGGWL